jgi:hypothetical protein
MYKLDIKFNNEVLNSVVYNNSEGTAIKVAFLL